MKHLYSYKDFSNAVNEGLWDRIVGFFTGGEKTDSIDSSIDKQKESPIDAEASQYKVKDADHLKSLLTGYTKSGANLGDYTTAQVIQTALVLVGTLKETEVDGVYGPITKSAIQSFENSAGIDSSLYGEALGKGTINELIKKIYS